MMEVRGEMNDHYSLLLFSSLMEMNRHKREVAKEAEDKVFGKCFHSLRYTGTKSKLSP